MKRRDPLNLAHVLEDSAPSTIPIPGDRHGLWAADPRRSDGALGVSAPSPSAATRGGATGSGPSTPAVVPNKRIHTRFDKVFLVVVGSELYGDSFAIARNLSAGGILVEMSYAPPLGTVVTVHFQHARDHEQIDEIVARAEVKHHHYLNFNDANDAASARAIGLRFIEFIDPDEPIAPERIH